MKISVYSIILVFVACLAFKESRSQNRQNPEIPWVSYPTANVTSYGVYHFRKTFDLQSVPQQLNIHISADNRYIFFVNGEKVSYGPAKGDLKTYKYDIVDIATALTAGKNVLAVLVFNAGKNKPMALLSAQTAFMFRTEDVSFKHLNSDQGWKTYQNPAYDPITYDELNLREWLRGYYAVGPGDEVFADKYPWGWEQPDFNDSQWLTPQTLDFNGAEPWNLVPRNIAFMDDHVEYPKAIRRATGIQVSENFLEREKPIVIPPNSKASILFDYGIFTMGYPELTVNGGKGSEIKISYAEALHEEPYLKAHRDSVDGKIMYGPFDIFHPDGEERTFRPLWKRAYRYIQLDISTEDHPLEIINLQSEYSGYPYPEMATFESDDARLDDMFEISLRTLRMCSGETYYDTPFYEQLSYGGDNRPIAAISTYNSTDDRLFREVMRLYPQSANRETKLFKSAYPSRFDFDMGTWSLAWVQTLWDYYETRKDMEFTKQFVDDIEGVLAFYEQHLDESKGVLGRIVGHQFVDWSNKKGSLPTGTVERNVFDHSAILTLYFAHTLDCVVKLYKEIGEEEKAEKWKALASTIKKAAYDIYWDPEKKIFADFPDWRQYSQHTNILAIMCDAIPEDDQEALLDQVLTYEFDEMASSYFTFFLFKIMEKLGKEDLYFENLDHWDYFLDKGHTTCGETGFMSHDRSDCHAWSGSPGYYHLRFIAGIKPADLGFENVLITPHLGALKKIDATMPHPKGRISISYEVKGQRLAGQITLPPKMNGRFEYKGNVMELKPGINKIKTQR
ncbi:MAG: family 78 glycoside hydrolase catalytic domain [Cyclobacteriaceae bacterium]